MAGFTMNSNTYGGASGVDLNARMRDLSTLGTGADNEYLARSRSTYGLAVETWQRSKDSGTPTGTPSQAGYPSNGTLSTRLRTAAHLLGANHGTRVITIHWGAFDTHTGQLASQDRQIAELSRALGAFRADLQRLGIEQRVATLVFSEFGRRVKESGTGTEAGTDHGAGGLMLAMGSGVRGGFAADWPGCELNELTPINNANQGNLKVPTDYRSVYLSVIEEWLGDDDPAGLMGGGAIESLVRGDGLTGRRLFT
jgi:uncharacterized protein (DUF1501 family)